MQQKLLRKALFFEYLTIVWNVLEGIVCITIGVLSGSIALIAYGLESGIEVFASSIVVWDLKGAKKEREKFALMLIGSAYFLASIYIAVEAMTSLSAHKHPETSFPGIIFIILTIVVMVSLGLIKSVIGKKMKSGTVLADAKFTLIDGGLAAAVLIGLILNAFFGWRWADQLMALILALVAFREGIGEFR